MVDPTKKKPTPEEQQLKNLQDYQAKLKAAEENPSASTAAVLDWQTKRLGAVAAKKATYDASVAPAPKKSTPMWMYGVGAAVVGVGGWFAYKKWRK